MYHGIDCNQKKQRNCNVTDGAVMKPKTGWIPKEIRNKEIKSMIPDGKIGIRFNSICDLIEHGGIKNKKGFVVSSAV